MREILNKVKCNCVIKNAKKCNQSSQYNNRQHLSKKPKLKP